MRIKRFEAKDTKTAISMVKKEMGDEAVILATRSIPTDKKGRTAKPLVEVVAAIDYDLDEIAVPPPGEDIVLPTSENAPLHYGYKHLHKKQLPKSSARSGSEIQGATRQGGSQGHLFSEKQGEQIHSEAQDLRLRFSNLLKQNPENTNKKHLDSKKIRPFKPQSKRPKPNPAEVAKWRDQLIDKIQLRPNKKYQTGQARIIALVGATGVGKTTTAAKLAAWYSLHQGKSVALLSMDCYRIGATDQLRTYARIMRLPCEIVLKKQDLDKALKRHIDKDIIIIDTAGKSPFDDQHINELQDWFSPTEAIEPYLVLSATTKKEDLHQVLETYSPLSIASLVLTKLDETRAYASLCQQVVASKLPISYLGVGQRVPEDLQVASKDFLETLFKKGWSAAAPQLRAFTAQEQ